MWSLNFAKEFVCEINQIALQNEACKPDFHPRNNRKTQVKKKNKQTKTSKQNSAAIEQLVLHAEVVPALNRKEKREAELYGCCYWASLYLNKHWELDFAAAKPLNR